MTKSFARIALATLTGLTALALTACGNESVGDALGTGEPEIRFAHAARNAPAVTLDRNGVAATQASNVSYEFVADYWTIDTGPATWGVTETATGSSIGTVTFDPDRGHRYTILAVTESLTSTSLVTIDDPTKASLTSDDGLVRVVNASLLTQRIDVYLSALDQDISALSPDFPNVDFKSASPPSGADSLRRRGVTYKVSVTPAGTKVVLFQGTLAVPENRDMLLIAVPSVGDSAAGVRLLAKVQGTPGAAEVPPL